MKKTKKLNYIYWEEIKLLYTKGVALSYIVLSIIFIIAGIIDVVYIAYIDALIKVLLAYWAIITAQFYCERIVKMKEELK